MRHCPFWEKGFALFKTNQLLLQLDLRLSITVSLKKEWSEALHLLPWYPHVPVLPYIFLEALSHCTPDSLTRCREAASHTWYTHSTQCGNIQAQLHTETHIPKLTGNIIFNIPWTINLIQNRTGIGIEIIVKYCLFDYFCYTLTVWWIQSIQKQLFGIVYVLQRAFNSIITRCIKVVGNVTVCWWIFANSRKTTQ